MSTSVENMDIESVLIKTFLNLEKIDPLLFRSTHLFKPTFGRAVYGGQVVGQALVAASKTVEKGREAHSLHCYFLRPGQIDNPILYQVLKTRDGLTYSNRFVIANQNGKPIFTMMVSFKEAEANNYSHQMTMPDVPGPENLLEVNDLLRLRLGENIGERERSYIEHRLTEEMMMERKPVSPEVYFNKKNIPAKQYIWFKVSGRIGDDQQMQKCAAAYMSDSSLLGTALLPGALLVRNGKIFMASLDHSIWFHHPIKADDWLLYEMESPQCGHGRAHTIGRLWNQDGTLVMSVSQEGVVRTLVNQGSSQHPQKKQKSRL